MLEPCLNCICVKSCKKTIISKKPAWKVLRHVSWEECRVVLGPGYAGLNVPRGRRRRRRLQMSDSERVWRMLLKSRRFLSWYVNTCEQRDDRWRAGADPWGGAQGARAPPSKHEKRITCSPARRLIWTFADDTLDDKSWIRPWWQVLVTDSAHFHVY